MQIARVIGNVVSTIKNESLEGRKILIVQNLNEDLEPNRKTACRFGRNRRRNRRIGFLVSRKRSDLFHSNAIPRRPIARLSELLIRMHTFIKRIAVKIAVKTQKYNFPAFCTFLLQLNYAY